MKHRRLFLLLPVLLLLSGCQTKTDVEKTNLNISRLTPKAEGGNAKAQYQLGLASSKIWKFAEANQWFRKAAMQGVPDAQYRLAVNCQRGEGVPKDLVEAFAWFNLAAAQNFRPAINAREQLTRKLSRAEIDDGDRRASAYVAQGALPGFKPSVVKTPTPALATNAPPAATNAPGPVSASPNAAGK